MSPMNKATPRYVYVIGTPSGPFKIGMAVILNHRLNDIQVGSHAKLKVLYSIKVRSHEAIIIERKAHRQLWGSRLSGEWFDTSLDLAKQAIATAARSINKNIRLPTDIVIEDQIDTHHTQRRIRDPDALTDFELDLHKKGLLPLLGPEYLDGLQDRIFRMMDRYEAAALGWNNGSLSTALPTATGEDA